MAKAGQSEAQRSTKRLDRTGRPRAAKRVEAEAHPTVKEGRFVEDVGLFYEQFGLPRMAGRILGWLMICNPPEQSLADLGQALQASKGSISTMTRLLLQTGSVVRTTQPGDRRDYVSIPQGALTQMLAARVKSLSRMRELAVQGLEALEGTPSEQRLRLRELHDMYVFLEREIPLLVNRWEREYKRSKQT
jgi:DNA-binding transcriptional regulator GbsR (MarR family)